MSGECRPAPLESAGEVLTTGEVGVEMRRRGGRCAFHTRTLLSPLSSQMNAALCWNAQVGTRKTDDGVVSATEIPENGTLTCLQGGVVLGGRGDLRRPS